METNKDKYRSKIGDAEALRKALTELEWANNAVDRLDRAVTYGRCTKCEEPLDYNTPKDVGMCEDCINEEGTH